MAVVRAWESFRRTPKADTAVVAAAAAVPQFGDTVALGSVEIVCGDYTHLLASFQQDVVFMDPPWGGPQYSCSAGRDGKAATIRQAATGASTGGGGTGDGSVPDGLMPAAEHSDCGIGGGKVKDYGDAVFMLGQRPLSHMVSELFVNGSARLVALKLPSRADVELRAMQSRTRQLVAAQCKQSAAGGGCCPRLLGVEVRLGRSSLVIFMYLPCSGNACMTIREKSEVWCRTAGGGGGGSGMAASGKPWVVPPGLEEHQMKHFPTGTGIGGISVDGDSGADEGMERCDSGCRSGDGDDSGDAGSDGDDGCRGARSGSSGRATSVIDGGCPKCRGQGAAFRMVLRESCSQLGLPYRVVCE